MLPMIKLVVSDIDGTILAGREAFPQSLIEVGRKLEEKGILFTFASGRLPYMIDPYMKLMGVASPVIACNGTYLYDGSHVISRHSMKLEVLRLLIEEALRLDMTVLYAIDGTEYCARENTCTARKRRERKSYHAIREITEEDWKNLHVDKVNILDEMHQTALLEPECCRISDNCSVTHYGDTGLEIVQVGYSKATGLMELAAYLGIELEETMAIGDNENDDEILKLAGIGVAVGNAKAETKLCADYVTHASGAEGVAEAITKFCLEEDVPL